MQFDFTGIDERGNIPRQEEITCPDCGDDMLLRRNRRGGLFYGCMGWPECSSTHPADPETGAPVGVPASRGLKALRKRALAALSSMTDEEGGPMTRSEAYRWMRKTMAIPYEDSDIRTFDEETCRAVIDQIAVYMGAAE